jgi:hypothetical protein
VANVLVVGNVFEDLSVLGLFFEFGGHCCELACGVQEAFAQLETRPFDLIVMDSTADDNCLTIAEALNGGYPQTPVLILTGAQCSRAHGESGCIDPRDLLTIIEYVLRTDPKLERLDTHKLPEPPVVRTNVKRILNSECVSQAWLTALRN